MKHPLLTTMTILVFVTAIVMSVLENQHGIIICTMTGFACALAWFGNALAGNF